MKPVMHLDKKELRSKKNYILNGLFYSLYSFVKYLSFPLSNYLRYACLVLFGAKIQSAAIGEGVTVFCPWDLKIGHHTTIGARCTLTALGGLTIGNDVRIAPNVMMLTTDHAYEDANTLIRQQGFKQARIEIGNDVWLGANIVILKGVSIGDGAVIGANSTVTGDIQPYSIAVGSPCKVIGKRT